MELENKILELLHIGIPTSHDKLKYAVYKPKNKFEEFCIKMFAPYDLNIAFAIAKLENEGYVTRKEIGTDMYDNIHFGYVLTGKTKENTNFVYSF